MRGLDVFRFFPYFASVIVLFQTIKVDANIHDVFNPVKDTLDLKDTQRFLRAAVHTNENLTCEVPDLYICEEPPDIVSPESTRTCNYRNVNYQEQVYKWVAGRGCLLYTPDFLYVAGVNTINLNAACVYGTTFAPCLEIAKPDGTCGCYPFDPGLEEVATAVQNALLPTAHGRWERCFEEAVQCCNYKMAENLDTAEDKCEPTYDGWTCWHTTDNGTVANQVCSEFAYSNQGPSCYHYSTKQCHSNGIWELQTDYSSCSITPRLLRRYRFYIAMLSFSIISCLPAVFVFFFYKRLRVTRVALHRNLLVAIILRNILVIISRSEIYIDELTNAGDTVMSTHGIACRILAILERVAANAVFVCMLVEGVYLHRLIVAVFRKKLKVKWLYAAGAVIAIGPVIAWSIVMGLQNDHSCWLVYTIDNIQWILDAPRLAILLINTILFVDVLRVLLTKIRNSENASQLSTTKASLFLMPIFGTQFLLTAFRPTPTNCNTEQAYYYVTYTVEGLQGFIVALLYCYVNKEVHTLVKATYKKTENAVVSRVRGDGGYGRPSLAPTSRRMTYSTGLASNYGEDKDDYSTITPKIHVAEIISIQASERLAEILDPVYETIEDGVTNDGYDSLERERDAEYNPRKSNNYYGFTNASSVSLDNQDWLRSVSPENSDYNNSQHDLDKKNLNEIKLDEIRGSQGNDDSLESINQEESGANNERETDFFKPTFGDNNEAMVDNADNDSMLDEIIQYMETNEGKASALDPNLLAPNRKDEDKIVFVDE